MYSAVKRKDRGSIPRRRRAGDQIQINVTPSSLKNNRCKINEDSHTIKGSSIFNTSPRNGDEFVVDDLEHFTIQKEEAALKPPTSGVEHITENEIKMPRKKVKVSINKKIILQFYKISQVIGNQL